MVDKTVNINVKSQSENKVIDEKTDVFDDLRKLKILKDNGIINEKEYEQKKKVSLKRM